MKKPEHVDGKKTPKEPESFLGRHDPSGWRRALPYASAAVATVGAVIGAKVALKSEDALAEQTPKNAQRQAWVEMSEAIQKEKFSPQEFLNEAEQRTAAAQKRMEDARDSPFVHTVKATGVGTAIGAAAPPAAYGGMIVNSVAAGFIGRRRPKKDKLESKSPGELGWE